MTACVVCKHGDIQPGTTTLTVERGEMTLVLKGVRSHAYLLERQREEALRRLQQAPSLPRQVKDPRSRKGVKHKVRSNSSTGVAGVTLLPKGRGWRATPAYYARWVDESGVRVSRTFAVSKYGKRGALKLAVRARREGMKRAAQSWTLGWKS